MALIKCPDCKTAISDSANRCPRCGCDYKRVLDRIKFLKQQIQYLEELKEPEQRSSLDWFSMLLWIIGGACLFGAICIPLFGIILLPVGGIFILSNVLSLIRGDVRKDNEARMDEYRKSKNSIEGMKKELLELEARFK